MPNQYEPAWNHAGTYAYEWFEQALYALSLHVKDGCATTAYDLLIADEPRHRLHARDRRDLAALLGEALLRCEEKGETFAVLNETDLVESYLHRY